MGVIVMNDYQKKRFSEKVVSKMFNTVTGKKIAIFGFAFKKDTGDVRETPAPTVCDMLMQDGAIVHVYDPKVTKKEALKEFGYRRTEVKDDLFIFADSPTEAVTGADAIVILTEWEEFKTYDYKDLYAEMRKPAFLFGGRNIVKAEELETIGYEVHMLGKSRLEKQTPQLQDRAGSFSLNELMT